VSRPEQDDFQIDLTFTGRNTNYARPVAAGVAIAGIIFIIATMTTDLAARLLPMSDIYLQVMIPAAPDGHEAIGLTSLMHNIQDKTISVSGSIMNRTDQTMSDIIAVVQMQDTTGRFPQIQEVPVTPADLPPRGSGTFAAMATLQEKPGGYLVKFRFADGPFIPHRDERASPYIAPPVTK
jgi:hypothetical protein